MSIGLDAERIEAGNPVLDATTAGRSTARDAATPPALMSIANDEEVATQSWRSHMVVGFGVLTGEAVGSAGYVLSAPGPHRPILVGITIATACAGLIGWYFADLASRRTWRTAFLVGWTILSVVVVATCAGLDGGLQSPLLGLAVLPLLYMSMLLSPRAVAIVGGVTAVALVVVGLSDPQGLLPDGAAFLLWAIVLGAVVLAIGVSRYRTRADSQRSELLRELHELAMTDSLTGCANHRAFYERLRSEVEQAVRYKRPLSLLVCDVDLFKTYNDTYGHNEGDAALAAVGQRIRAAARASDVVGRIGGDEFAVLMPETSIEAARTLAGRLTAGRADGREPSLSVGIACLSATFPTAAALFHAADAAMYRAKAAGRGRFVSSQDETVDGASLDLSADGRRIAEIARSERRQRLEAEAIFETALDDAPVGFAFVDPDFRLLRANRTIAGFGGYDSIEHIGQPLPDLIPHVWPILEPHFQAVLADRHPVRNFEISLADGGGRLTSLYPIQVGGQLIGIGVVVVDISDRKRFERSQAALTDAVVRALANAVEARDPYTAGHQRRVANIAATTARALGYDEHTVEGIRLAAAIHDIGKLAVPAELLARPVKLTAAEMSLVQTHAQAGHDMIADIKFPWPVAEMILQHHERLDGSGYPNGLRGDQVGVGARIIAVADVIEAVSSRRPYRGALGLEAGLSVVHKGRGGCFDADVVDTCTALFRDGTIRLERDASA